MRSISPALAADDSGTGSRVVVAAPRTLSGRALFALLAVYCIWGSTYLVMRWAALALPPLLTAAVRFLTAGTVLLCVQRLRGAPWPNSTQWAWSVPIGTLMFLFGNGAVAVTVAALGSGTAAVVCGTMPLCAAAYSSLLFGERPRPREWLGLSLGFVGVVVLASGHQLRGHAGEGAGQALRMGVLFLAPLGWALGSVWGRRLPLPAGLSSAATQMLTGGVALVIGALVHGEQLPTVFALRPLLALAYLTVFGSLVGFSAYMYLLQNVKPSVAMSYSYVNPVLAVALAILLDHEPLTVTTVIATACVTGAVAILMRAPAKLRR